MSEQTIGRYRVLRRLGSGGMGEIFLAHDASLERRVALKLLRKEAASEPDARARFRREAKALAALRHPGIVTIYEIGREDDRDFIAMEYLEGQTLRELLREALPRRDLLAICAETALAVAAAHRAGVLHRDLKPENIMTTAEGAAVVVDFGLAQRLGDEARDPTDTETLAAMLADTVELGEASANLSAETATLFGTPGYMPPEVLRGLTSSEASDVYSLGVVLFEALAGRLPFLAPTVPETLAKIMDPAIPPPRLDEAAECPGPISDLVARMLAHEPGERPHMDEVARVLRSLASPASKRRAGSEIPGGPKEPTSGRRKGRVRPRHVGVTLAAAAAAGVVALVATTAMRGDGEPPPAPITVGVAPISVSASAFSHSEMSAVSTGVLLGSVLSRSPHIDIIDAERLASSVDGDFEPQALRRAARELGATYLVKGEIDRRDGDFVGSVRAVRTLGENASSVQRAARADAAELSALFPLLGRELASQLLPGVEPVPVIEPGDADVLASFQRGIEDFVAFRWAPAAVHLERAAHAQPAFVDAWYYLALASAWARLPPPQTLEAASRAVDLARSERDRELMRALSHYISHHYGEAIDILAPLAKRYPRDRDVLYLMGEALYHDGRYDEGVEFFDRVLAIAPGFDPAAYHPYYYAVARRDEQSAEFYLRFLGESAREDFELLLPLALGRYDDILAGEEWDRFHRAALALSGRADAIDGFLAGADPTPRLDAEALARALATGHHARAREAFDRLIKYLEASSNPSRDEWLHRRAGTTLLIAEANDELASLLSVWEENEANPFPTVSERTLAIHAAPLLQREELLELEAPSTREKELIAAARAELRGDRADAAERWSGLVAVPTETGDYLARYALARNLRALGREAELAALCEDMRQPALYAPAYHVFRARCETQGRFPAPDAPQPPP